MSFSAVVFCVSAVLVQIITAQCVDYAAAETHHECGCGNIWAGDGIALFGRSKGWDYGVGHNSRLLDSYGGTLLVTSSSPLAPSGLRLISENTLEGDLSVLGQLPFLGAVAMDGALPTSGEAHATYGCGNGNVRILDHWHGISNDYGAGHAAVSQLGLGADAAAHGYNHEIIVDNRVCGCGNVY